MTSNCSLARPLGGFRAGAFRLHVAFMVSPRKLLRLRMRRVQRRLKAGSSRLLLPSRRLQARFRRFRRATQQAAEGLFQLGGFVRAMGRAQRKRRRETARFIPVRHVGAEVGKPAEPRTELPTGEPQPSAPRHADERTIRRTAERQQHGISTEEMLARYEAGLNPGGLHQRARPSSPETEGRSRESAHAHAYDDEPPDPKIRRPGHTRGMSTKRAGS